MTRSAAPARGASKPRAGNVASGAAAAAAAADTAAAEPGLLDNRLLQFVLCMIVAVSAYIYISPSPISPVAFTLPAPADYGAVTTFDLNKAQLAWKARVNKGPESIAFDPAGKWAYFGSADGKILRASLASPLSAPEPMTTVGDPNRALPLPCGTYDTQAICGRPLGMAYHPNGFLVFADAYFGLLAMDPISGQLQRITNSVTDPATRKTEEFSFANGLTVARDGKIYFTISSTKHELKDYMLEILESGNNGGVAVYDPASRKTTYLTARNALSFPNGVVLSPDESFLIVSELNRARLVKIPLAGPKKGQPSTYADNLPTLPDNLRWADGLLLVGGSAHRAAGSFSLVDLVASRPWARKLLAKAVPKKYLAAVAGDATPVLVVLRPVSAGAGTANQRGEVVQVMRASNSRVAHLSEAAYFNGALYLGSYGGDVLGVAKLTWSPETLVAASPRAGLAGVVDGAAESREAKRAVRAARAAAKGERRALEKAAASAPGAGSAAAAARQQEEEEAMLAAMEEAEEDEEEEVARDENEQKTEL